MCAALVAAFGGGQYDPLRWMLPIAGDAGTDAAEARTAQQASKLLARARTITVTANARRGKRATRRGRSDER